MPLRLIGLRTQDLQSEFRFRLSKSVVLRNPSYGHLLKSYTFSQKFEAWEQYTFKFYPIEPAYQKKITQPNFGTCGVSVHFFRKRRQNKHPSFFFLKHKVCNRIYRFRHSRTETRSKLLLAGQPSSFTVFLPFSVSCSESAVRQNHILMTLIRFFFSSPSTYMV